MSSKNDELHPTGEGSQMLPLQTWPQSAWHPERVAADHSALALALLNGKSNDFPPFSLYFVVCGFLVDLVKTWNLIHSSGGGTETQHF